MARPLQPISGTKVAPGASEIISTSRLSLVPLTAALAEAALHDRSKLAERLGVTVPKGWPNDDFRGALPLFLLLFSENPRRSDWSRLIIERSQAVLVGEVGFKDVPNGTGTAEIGYGVAPDYHGQGYATEAASALIHWAFQQPELKRVLAECREDNLASIRVLEKLGMTRLRPRGGMLRWELLKDPAAGSRGT